MPPRNSLKAVDEEHVTHLHDVEEFAASLPDKFLHCRELGHLWKHYQGGRHRDGGFQRVLRCGRCSTRRVQELSSRGMVLGSHYIHPEGYLSKGVGHIAGEGRGLLRLESMTRNGTTETWLEEEE